LPIPTNEERIGTILADKYKIVRVIGEGGMGVVFEGRHEFTRRAVAVKLLHPHLSKHEATVRRFLGEARAAAAIKHRNVVDVLDMGREVDGQVYLVLEFLTGEALSARLRREVLLDPDEAAAILLPIMSALRGAHARGIVHRDIKPENIFIARDEETGDEVPKLLDFGIAKIDGGVCATSAGEAIGTPSYMSPEQATDAAVVDARADIWSVGVLWFEALTGRLPYEADTVMQMLAMLISTDPLRLSEVAPHVPPPLARAVERALVRDREARWPSLDPFIDALRECFPRVEVRVSPGGVDAAPAVPALTRATRDPLDPAMRETAAEADLVALSAAPPPRRARWRAAVIAAAVLGLGGALALRASPAAHPPRAPSTPTARRAEAAAPAVASPTTGGPTVEALPEAGDAGVQDTLRVALPAVRTRATRTRRAAGERAAVDPPRARVPEASAPPARVRVMSW
jgi:serine/threonine protein kinase